MTIGLAYVSILLFRVDDIYITLAQKIKTKNHLVDAKEELRNMEQFQRVSSGIVCTLVAKKEVKGIQSER